MISSFFHSLFFPTFYFPSFSHSFLLYLPFPFIHFLAFVPTSEHSSQTSFFSPSRTKLAYSLPFFTPRHFLASSSHRCCCLPFCFSSSPFTFASYLNFFRDSSFVFPVLISNDHTLLIQHSLTHTFTHDATTTTATATTTGRLQEATLFLPCFLPRKSTTTFNILFFHPVATNPDALCRDPGIILQGTLPAPPRLRPSALPLCL